MAGQSADAMARRQRDKIARLERAAAMWERGAAGERATANALKALPADDWVVLHDLRWPGRPFANIDHIAIGPGGVFVIDSKNWSGRVQLTGDVLRQNGRPRGREVLSSREAAAAVSRRLIYVPPDYVTPVLCIVGSDVGGRVGQVVVCHKTSIVDALTSRQPVLTPDMVRAVANDLRGQLQSAAPTARPTPAQEPKPARRQGILTHLAAPVAGLAFVATVAVSPQVITGVVDGVGSIVSNTVDSGTKPAEPPRHQHHHRKMADRP